MTPPLGNLQRRRFVAPYSADLIHALYPEHRITLATGVAGWGDSVVSPTVNELDFTQLTTTKQPTYGAFTANPALVFDGVQQCMQSPAIALSSYSEITIALSLRFTGTAGTKIFLEVGPTFNSQAGGFVVYEGGPNAIALGFWNGTTSNNVTTSPISAGVYRLVFVVDTTAVGSFPRRYLNGVSFGTAAENASCAFPDVPWNMGARNGYSLFWGGKMGDLWVYGRALTVPEISIVDAALAARCT